MRDPAPVFADIRKVMREDLDIQFLVDAVEAGQMDARHQLADLAATSSPTNKRKNPPPLADSDKEGGQLCWDLIGSQVS